MRKAIEEISFNRAYIVFEDNVHLWWLRFLKRGFRHCYLLFCIEENTWLEVNPASNQVVFLIHKTTPGLDYINHLCSDASKTILSIHLSNSSLSTAPLGFFTCVEFAKRSLGIHSFFTITPYQLYKKLVYNL